VKADVGKRTVDAIAFVVNHRHPQYAGTLPDQEILEILRTAAGLWGTGRQYLLQTLDGLRAHGIVDRRLEVIARALG
jgi:cation transport protein ChaC